MHAVKRVLLLCILTLSTVITISSLYADESAKEPFITRVVLNAGIAFPAGDTADMYENGYTGEFFVQKQLPPFPMVELFLNTGYSYIPLLADRSEISLGSVGAGACIDVEPFHRFHIIARVWGGYYYGQLHAEESRGSSGFISEAVDLGYDITPALRLSIGGAYRNFMDVHSDFTVWAGVGWRFGAGLTDPYRSSDAVAEPLYPDLVNYYNAGNPVARVHHANDGDDELVKYSLFLDIPKVLEENTLTLDDSRMDAGSEGDQSLQALFSDALASYPGNWEAKLNADYKYKGWPLDRTTFVPVEIRGSVDWDDAASYALFISSRDLTVLDRSQHMAALIDKQTLAAIRPSVLLAVGFYQDLKDSGIRYSESSDKPRDWVSDSDGRIPFPSVTLESGEGNRDALTLLYLAELEALGVRTGMIHADDKLLAAIGMELSREEAETEYSRPEDILWFDDAAWLPIDLAGLDKGFTAGMEDALGHIADAENLEFVSTASAWEAYPQTAFSADLKESQMSDPDYLLNSYIQEIRTLTEWKIDSHREAFLKQLKKDGENVQAMNNLGVLLAEYELYGEALEHFVKILLLEERMETLVNVANIHYLQGDLRRAMTFYERARRVDPYNPVVLLGLARVNFELKNYGDTKDSFSKLETVDPEMAAKFAIMQEQGDAALEEARHQNLHRVIYWLEVEDW